MENMVNKRTWDEFRETGLLWFVNTILHAFGWAICIDTGDECADVSVFPARVKFRGFPLNANDAGYRKVARYMKENADDIYDDAIEVNL